MQLRSLASLALTGALFLGACTIDSVADTQTPDHDTQDAVGGGAEVAVTNNEFTPATLEVDVGDNVVWHFEQGTHNVVFADAESEALSNGSWERTFDEPGTYDYQCTLHSGMTGTIVVQGSD